MCINSQLLVGWKQMNWVFVLTIIIINVITSII